MNANSWNHTSLFWMIHYINIQNCIIEQRCYVSTAFLGREYKIFLFHDMQSSMYNLIARYGVKSLLCARQTIMVAVVAKRKPTGQGHTLLLYHWTQCVRVRKLQHSISRFVKAEFCALIVFAKVSWHLSRKIWNFEDIFGDPYYMS